MFADQMLISDQLLELGFLTEEEKAKLQKVLAADENLQKNQYNHFMLVPSSYPFYFRYCRNLSHKAT